VQQDCFGQIFKFSHAPNQELILSQRNTNIQIYNFVVPPTKPPVEMNLRSRLNFRPKHVHFRYITLLKETQLPI
jgi:hypothetical protein